MISLTCSKRH